MAKRPAGFYFLVEVAAPDARAMAAGAKPSPPGAPPRKSPLIPGPWFQMAKTGTFHSPVYGEISITPQDLASMERNFRTVTPLPPTQLPIDYDHLSDEPQAPGDGRAGGWIQSLQLRANGNELWCLPAWTEPAARMLAAREYRFISPYFLTDYLDKRTGKRVGPTLKAAALTNRPFLEGMEEIPAPAIAASDRAMRAFGNNRRVATPANSGRPRPASLTEKTMPIARLNADRSLAEPPMPPAAAMGGDDCYGMAGDTNPDAAPPPGPPAPPIPPPHHGGAAGHPGLTCPHCGAPVSHDGSHASAPVEMSGPHGEPDPSAPMPPDVAGAGPAPAPGGPGLGPLTDDGPEPGEIEGAEPTPAEGGVDAGADATGTAPGPGGGSEPPEQDVEMGDMGPPSPAGGMSMGERRLAATVASLQKEVAQLRQRDRRSLAERYLLGAQKAGKVNPRLAGTAEKPGWARSFAFRDPEGFRAWATAAPVVVGKRPIDTREIGTNEEVAVDDATATAGQIEQLVAVKMREAKEQGKVMFHSDAVKAVMSENRALAERYDRQIIGERNPGSGGNAQSHIRRL